MLEQFEAIVRLMVMLPVLSPPVTVAERPLTVPLRLWELILPSEALTEVIVAFKEVPVALKIVADRVPVSGLVTPALVFVPEYVPFQLPFRLHWATAEEASNRSATTKA